MLMRMSRSGCILYASSARMHTDAATEHSTTEEDVETDHPTTEVTVQQQIYYETRAEEPIQRAERDAQQCLNKNIKCIEAPEN